MSQRGGKPGGRPSWPADVSMAKTLPSGATETPSTPTVNEPSLPPADGRLETSRLFWPFERFQTALVSPTHSSGARHCVPARPAAAAYSVPLDAKASPRGLSTWSMTTTGCGVLVAAALPAPAASAAHASAHALSVRTNRTL